MRSARALIRASGERLTLGADGATVVADRLSAGRPARRATAESVALWVFVAYLVVAWWVLIFELGADRWFLLDDWWFLTGRDGGSWDDLLRPHSEHLTLLPVLAYRVMLNLFGVRFTPFLVLLVSMHLTVAALLRIIMRRAGVGPWLATAAAAALVFFGSGYENIQWAFQITFVGALLFGLVQLILADHDGPIGRRDWFGLAAGLAALLCSGLGPLMVGVVGLASLVRRGWRAAAFHTLPLAALYLLWYQREDPGSSTIYGRPPASEVLAWVRVGTEGTFEALGHVAPAGIALAAVLVIGLGLWARDGSWTEARRRAAPLALLAAGPVFLAVTSQGRWLAGAEVAASSRYLYVGAVLSLPALALAAQAIASRWAVTTPVLALLFLVGVPGNMGEFNQSFFLPAYSINQRQTILGAAYAPEARSTPSWVRPDPQLLNGPTLTVGWLLEQRALGRLPEPGAIKPEIEAQFPLRLGLVHAQEPALGLECSVERSAVHADLVEGDRIRIVTPVNVTLLDEGDAVARPLVYNPRDGNGTLEVVTPELSVRFGPVGGAPSFEWCR